MASELRACPIGERGCPIGRGNGYIVCRHILAGALAVHHERPSLTVDPPDGLGELLCKRDDHTADDVVLCCARCAWPYIFRALACHSLLRVM